MIVALEKRYRIGLSRQTIFLAISKIIINFYITKTFVIVRFGFKNPVTSRMEFLVTIVNGFQKSFSVFRKAPP